MSLAFVFLLVGYGTKIGLVPLHNWLPDAHSEGPTPMSAILSGLLLNDALYAVVRCKMLVDGSTGTQMAGYLMMGFGLLSFLVAALFLHRQKDIKRLYSYSSIEHMGIMTFAFGLGGPLATFAALMHMTVHSLTKSAIFVTVGHAAQVAKTQQLEHIRGLIKTQPARHVVGQFFDQMFQPVRRVADPGLDEALCGHLAGYLATPAIAARSDDDRTLILATCLRETVAPAARESETCAIP
jgi:formate hydrogenlyase subunit 3/multisubunit Na+/H+ antiporter MnhD subunit